jgi:ankyrin repeat protein
MWASAQSQAEMVRFLVEAGADVNARGVIHQWERKVITEPRPKDLNHGASRRSCTRRAKGASSASSSWPPAAPISTSKIRIA